MPNLASEGEKGVAEEADCDDGSAEELDWVDVWDDAAAGQVVIDHGGVDPPGPHQPGLLHGLDDQLPHPVRDGVHLALGEQFLIAHAPFLQLTSVGVTLAEKVLCPVEIIYVMLMYLI